MERLKARLRSALGKWAPGTDSLPQLLMWYPHETAPVVGELEAGYRLRSYRSGDEEGWMHLLNANGELGCWNPQRLREELDGALRKEAQFFVFAGKQIVAAAGVYERELGGAPCWEIGWVASHPQHRGKGLGLQVTAAAVAAALALPPRRIALRTDDFRVPALKIYLKLGFVPDLGHPSYAGRWRKLALSLGESYVALEQRARRAP